MKDVTESYVPVSDVSVFFKGGTKHDYGYLAVFNNMSLQSVAWTERRWGRTVDFKKMGRGVVYFPVSYDYAVPEWEITLLC